ncbi:hypothetical protein J6590_003278 [Homalodisca vitripennis]|nr:hypothetical protein J6590_003278 [Homalodisca vitripennis]
MEPKVLGAKYVNTIGIKILNLALEIRGKRWMSTIRNVDFIHSNGKTWLFSETTHGSTPKQPSGWDSLTVRTSWVLMGHFCCLSLEASELTLVYADAEYVVPLIPHTLKGRCKIEQRHKD